MGNSTWSTVLKRENSDKRAFVKRIQKMASRGELHDTANSNVLSQWVETVTRFSSQYDTNSWPATCVIGPPRVYPKYGDIPGAWASSTIDERQFLEVEFKEAVFVTGMDIYETYHAGGVKAIKALGEDGKWHNLWKTDRVTVIKSSRVFKPELAELSYRTKNIRVEVDCTGCGTWVEIDAIQLHGCTYLIEPPPPMEDLSRDLGAIVNDERFSDCQFLLEGKKTVYAHKAIICARSDYFRAMFEDQTKESKSKTAIEIKDVSYDSFIAVLHFLYTNSLPPKLKEKQKDDTIILTDVWRVADRLSMDGFKRLAAYMISLKIDDKNVVDTYVAAVSKLPVIDEVKNNCMLYMSTHLQSIVNTASFTALPQDVMLEIIQGTTAKLKI
ncbi:uncharacterized protein LOC132755993 isoform X1 [Ruditapes philippinarum]|uniref:uncharacterized protein LOC132755993 isoform X1 n=1 Tax=Ruditapes philippinarum TaxID=129788 RepID=UPI00295B2DA3|nr:uncharacterized protein LOC132755993 isoform X1 [Ruditapes philippinarum]